MIGSKGEKILKTLWQKYRAVGLVVLAGVILLAWPSGSSGPQKTQDSGTVVEQEPLIRETEREMESILSKIDGAGQLHLMLTVEAGAQQELAEKQELSYRGSALSPEDYSRRTEPVLASESGKEEPVVLWQTYPVYRGALVVCEGGSRPEVKLAVTHAVAALTGLRSDRITVVKCQ